jgi:iron complex transport system permease protein
MIISYAAGLTLILSGLVLSVCYGAKTIGFRDVVGGIFSSQRVSTEQLIVWDTRLPRAISATLIGAFLACGGAALQGVARNPIATPSIMGVNQGAILAVAVYMATQAVPAAVGKVSFAFLGASVCAALVFLISTRRTNLDITRLLLAGTALGMLFAALASMIALLTNNSKNLSFWMAGGVAGATWESVRILALVSPVLAAMVALSPKVAILSLGDEVAVGLGERPNRVRFLCLLCVSLLVGAAAAVGGNIGYICLIIPQIARRFVGVDYRRIIPVSAVFGGVLMVYSDIAARMLNYPFEIPVGSITSLIGVPVLVYLVRKERRA